MKVVILTASTMKKTIGGNAFSGRCVTAFDLENNRILRFVQNEDGAPMENPYCDFYLPLEVHDIDVIKTCPLKCQTENVLADYTVFNYLGMYRGGILDLYGRFQTIDYGDSSFMLDGSNKLQDISPYKHSLELVKVTGLTIEGKKCSFIYEDKHYKFVSVTDPEYALPDGAVKSIGDAILAISIPTEDFDGKGFYKFVASVFLIQ